MRQEVADLRTVRVSRPRRRRVWRHDPQVYRRPRLGGGNEDSVTAIDQRSRTHPTLEAALCIPAGMNARRVR